MIEPDSRDALVRYRMQQAKDTIEEAQLLFEHDKLRAAANRIYYGMFYALLALGNQFQFATSKHGQLIGWFNREFIKTRRIDRKYGKYLKEAFEVRSQGDYDAFIEFSKENIEARLERMREFIAAIELCIKGANPPMNNEEHDR
ncbi:MAG: HEPN domain-containing protein [Deferribacteres bacterium]|nr:HEPN domain-containing protein [Deferribacteres bacterium]